MKNTPFIHLVRSLPVLILFILMNASCSHETINPELLDTVCFENQILTILGPSCGNNTGCHNATSAEAGFVATDYASIMQIVTPYDPKGSKLYQVITDINSDDFMPPDHPLSLTDRSFIEVWIAQGAKNDTACANAVIDTGGTNPVDWGDSVCFVQDILPIFLPSCGTDRNPRGCHSIVSQQEDYILVDYPTIMSSEDGIIPGDAAHSRFIDVLTGGEEEDERMPPPPFEPLNQDQIDLLTTWINDGALNSNCPDGSCDTLSAITYSKQVTAILQNCVSCHDTPPGNGGILLDSYQNVVAATEVTRDNTSVLIGALRHYQGFTPMPSPDYQLSECSIRTIELWMTQPVPAP